jgi:hypothetical protein
LTDDKPAGNRLEFRRVSLCDYIDEEATKAGFRVAHLRNTHLGCSQFLASDGEELFAYDGQFPTPEEAKRYLDWKVARYFKILSRGIKTNRRGEKVGYRVEVLVAADHKDSAVMWTNGAMFYQIIAKSLADAEELEKR